MFPGFDHESQLCDVGHPLLTSIIKMDDDTVSSDIYATDCTKS